MMTPFRLAFGSAASLMLCACDPATPVDPAANLIDNFVIDVDEQAVPPPEPRSDTAPEPGSNSADQKPRMPRNSTTTPPPARPPTPPPAKAPAPPPRRVILPSPTQPPAEIDPVQPYPGDEVPR